MAPRAFARRRWAGHCASGAAATLAPREDFAPVLARTCPAWAALRDRHEANVMIEAAERHFRDRFDAGADVPADLIEQMQALVTKLAHTHDPDEDRLHKERLLEGSVTRTGDREEAQRQFSTQDRDAAVELNILDLVSASAFPASPGGTASAPTVTELLTIVLSKDLIVTAADRLHERTQRQRTAEVRVGSFQERVCTFACGTDEEDVEAELTRQAAEWKARIGAEIIAETDEQKRRLRRFWRRPFPAAAGSAGVLAAVPFAVPTGVAAVDFVAPGVAIFAGAVARGWSLLRRERMGSLAAREIPAINRLLDAAAKELTDHVRQEQRSDQLRPVLQRFLGDLTPDHAYRRVRPVDGRSFPQSRGFPDWTPMPREDRPELSPPDDARSLS